MPSKEDSALPQPIAAVIERVMNRPADTDDGEIPLYCGKCQYGWIIEDGRARRCPCNARRSVGMRQDRVDALLARHRAGMTKKFASVTAHTFLVRPGHEHVKRALDEYVKHLEQGRRYGFFIFGRTGVGKSYAAAYIVNTVKFKRLMTASMVNFSRVLTALRSTFRDEDEHQALLSVLFDTPLLAIDDLGMEQRVSETPDLSWAVSKFYEVIDYRRDNDLPTLITSNRTPDELAERLGEPIMTRIRNLTLRLDMKPVTEEASDAWK